MRTVRQAIAAMLIAALVLVVVLTVIAGVRQHPQDMPWTKLDLADPVGMLMVSVVDVLASAVAGTSTVAV